MPEWANWTAATFVGAWVQRLVAAVQVSNAQCVLSALSRVGVGVAAAISSSLPVPCIPEAPSLIFVPGLFLETACVFVVVCLFHVFIFCVC